MGKLKRTVAELNEFKIAHTRFDRRVKLTPEDRKFLAEIYNRRKELNLKVKDIAEVFGINANIVSRYANYQHYLDMQKIYTNTYTKKMSLSKRRKISRENARNTLRYKDNLLTVIEEAV